jgi:UDP-N-acetyl-2-amino-2-deoxyglucuronate dehydrogenase
MAKIFKVGLLGCGGIAGAHAPGFMKASGLCEVAAVAEPNQRRHGWIRETFGADVPIVDDYRKVLAIEEIDAVDIVLPHDLHMQAAVDAANAGKHVLTEKVMARNIWECDRMIEACEKAGITLTVTHDRRYHSEWEALKDIIDSGDLGEIFFWKLDHNQNVEMPIGHWIRSRNAIGGGAIMSCLTHQIDGLRWYGGEVKNVTCRTKVDPRRMEGEFLGVLIAEMESGAMAELSINWMTRSNSGDNRLWYEMVQVCGTEGEAYRMDGKGTFVRLHPNAGQTAIQRYGEEALNGFVSVDYSASVGGHVGCIVEWAKMICGLDNHVRTSGREARGTVEVAEAAYRSVNESRTIGLPITPETWEDFPPMESHLKPLYVGSLNVKNADDPLA